jgi:hypothetical protein
LSKRKAISFRRWMPFSVLVLLAANATLATNGYYVSTTGSDANPCTQDKPCLTVQHVIGMFTLASDGAVIHVAAGTYTDVVDDATLSPACQGNKVWFCANRGGTSASAQLTIQCDGSNWPNWPSSGGCVANPGGDGSTASLAEFNQASWVTLKGFEYGNHPGATLAIVGYGGGSYVGGTHISIAQNYFHDVGQTAAGGCPEQGMISISYTATGWILAQNKLIHFGNDSKYCNAAQIIYAGNGVIIQNNIIARAPGFGIQLYQADCNNMVANNVIFDNRSGGIIVDNDNGNAECKAGANTVTNNIIESNGVYADGSPAGGMYGISQHDSETYPNLYANNILHGNNPSDACGGCTGTVNGNIINEAPGTTFVNFQNDGSGDYHIHAGSQAIEGGPSAGAGAPGCPGNCPASVDFAGNPQPAIAGTSVNIGAYGMGSKPPAPPTALTAISQM